MKKQFRKSFVIIVTMEYQNVQASVNFSHMIKGPAMLPGLCNRPILFVSSRGTPCTTSDHPTSHFGFILILESSLYIARSGGSSQNIRFLKVDIWGRLKYSWLLKPKTNIARVVSNMFFPNQNTIKVIQVYEMYCLSFHAPLPLPNTPVIIRSSYFLKFPRNKLFRVSIYTFRT